MSCRNRLIVIGDENERNRFLNDIIINNEFDFEQIIENEGMPAAPLAKFEAFRTSVQTGDDCSIIEFTTDSRPYSTFFQIVMAGIYPTLMFRLLYVQRSLSCGYYKCAFNFRSFHKEEMQFVKRCKKKLCDGFCRKCGGKLHYFQREYQELLDKTFST